MLVKQIYKYVVLYWHKNGILQWDMAIMISLPLSREVNEVTCFLHLWYASCCLSISQWYIKVSLHNKFLIIIKQNRHYCVNIRFFCAVGKRYCKNKNECRHSSVYFVLLLLKSCLDWSWYTIDHLFLVLQSDNFVVFVLHSCKSRLVKVKNSGDLMTAFFTSRVFFYPALLTGCLPHFNLYH
jgi:hypothetical protein